MITISGDTDEPSPEAVNLIIAATSPAQIRVDEVEAGPVRTSAFTSSGYSLGRGIPQYALAGNDDHLLVRIEHTLTIGDDDSTAQTTIRVVHLATFECTDDLETTAPAIAEWFETAVYFIIYPYVRQFFTALTADMGIPPVVLDYLRQPQRDDSGSTDASTNHE
ncbi:hypothetical protein GII33_21195 [Gordonia pseudamarae]|jgi:hypothetical protein|uniref:Preprotein translocase subunit SecB n=1 Tax=Gordonia pseudamarae TaxID=2831662 RepID=A0ABX6IMP9_9ACTN|nr:MULTISPECIES: hypothetical protein [Gordonia]MBD0023809.1 hypothetical protein [Gordonia sp. (in: high G+C Gram-positive bacteria)]QHN28113.1 hypothetical protein GII33_21195 [Gordonia pseudamarae]QHN36976.1 hypothetical protein GII31_20830 [Gordonia pseudamarae]